MMQFYKIIRSIGAPDVVLFVLVQLVISLLGLWQSNLMRNIQVGLFSFAVLMLVKLALDVAYEVVSSAVSVRARLEYQEYNLKEYCRLSKPDQEKESIESFRNKLSRALNAKASLYSWGSQVVLNVVTTMLGFVYIFVIEKQVLLMVCFFVLNGLWYLLLTKHMMASLKRIRDSTRKKRSSIDDKLHLLYAILQTPYASVSKIIDQTRALEESQQSTSFYWECLSILQQLPNCIMLLILAWYVPPSQYTTLYLVFKDVKGTVIQLSNFMIQYQRFCDDIATVDDEFFSGKKFVDKPAQKSIPEILEISVMEDSMLQMRLTIRQGCRYWITGESGAGKTTLIKMLRGDIGGVVFDIGNPLEYEDKNAYMDQNIREKMRVNTISIRQLFGDNAPDSIIIQCLTIACLSEWFKEKTLDEPINNRISGGEKSRLCLAVTLYWAIDQKCQWLILDELDQGIDEKTVTEILKNIFAAFPNITIFVIGHKIDPTANIVFDQEWHVGDHMVVKK